MVMFAHYCILFGDADDDKNKIVFFAVFSQPGHEILCREKRDDPNPQFPREMGVVVAAEVEAIHLPHFQAHLRLNRRRHRRSCRKKANEKKL